MDRKARKEEELNHRMMDEQRLSPHNKSIQDWIDEFRNGRPDLPAWDETLTRYDWLTTLERVRDTATASDIRCIRCRQVVFYYPADTALIPGHCYTHAGVREVRITGYCEYCFDELFKGLDRD